MTQRILVASRFDPLEPRPQPLQILSAAAGIADAGGEVTLVMDGRAGHTRAHVEAHLGRPLGSLMDLVLVQGDHPGIRGLRRRITLARLLRQPWDAVLTRDFRLCVLLDRLRSRNAPGRLIHEWHSVPSALGQGGEGEERAARTADAHVFVSPGLGHFVSDRFSIGNALSTVLPNGCWIDAESTARCLAALPDARRVLTAGLFHQPADGKLLVRVAQGIGPRLQITVAGSAPPQLDGIEGVTTLGTLPPARMPDLGPGSLCQLALYRDDLNTRQFACPLKVVAAMASGVPLVATDLPTVRNLVEHGRSALLVPPSDPDAVLAAIGRLDEDRDLAAALAEQALRDAVDLTWKRRGERLLRFVEAS